MKEPMNCQVDLETLKQRANKLEGENPEIMMMSAVDCVYSWLKIVDLARIFSRLQTSMSIIWQKDRASQKYRPSFLPCSSNGVPREQGQAFLRLPNIWVAAM